MFEIDHDRARLQALVWMFAGTAVVFFTVLFMNNLKESGPEKKVSSSTEFEVKQVKKPRPVEKKVEAKKKNVKKISIPTLGMNSELSGIDLGLDAYSVNELGDMDNLLGDTNDVVMTSDLVDSPPKPLKRTAAEYPRRARAKDIEGYVVVSLLIDKTGRVKEAKVIEAEPAGIFDDSAIQTVKGWLFEPARYKGNVVDSWANQTIRYDLS